MNEFLENLFHASNAKEFVKLIKEAQEKYAEPQAYLDEVSDYLPVRVYERYYDDTVPHCFFGLMSASLAQDILPTEQKWWPYVQQSWFAVRERKRTPWEVNSSGGKAEGDLENRWRHFADAASAGDFSEAFAWARGFMGDEEGRRFFRPRSLSFALEDTAHGGLKYLYLRQAWRLAESLQWKNLGKILFPPLHFLVTGPRDHSLAEIVRRNPSGEKERPGDSGSLAPDRFERLERKLLFTDEPDQALRALQEAAGGAGPREVLETLLVAGAQAVINSRAAKWIWPMRAFHTAYFLREGLGELESRQQMSAVSLAAVLLQQASLRSRELEENRPLDEVARSLCPTEPLKVLKSLISHTDPYASATAIYAILGMDDEKKEELYQTLMAQAIKNDGHIGFGNDILFVYEAVNCHRQSQLAQKDTLILAAGFFLGRIHKSYELFGEYGFA